MDFDLSLDEAKKAETISALMGMFQSPGWNILATILNKNVAIIDQVIDEMLDGDSPDVEKIKDYRKRRKYILKLLDMPQNIYTDLTVKNQVVDFDPYK